MSNIVKISDFIGFRYIANNKACEQRLQYFIDEYEDYYLTKLLGCELTPLFLADLVDGVPQKAEYLELYNKFCIEFYGKEYYSKGMVKCLTGLIYYHYVREDTYKHSLAGVVKNSNENSEVLSGANLERVAETRYNDSVNSFNAISLKAYDLELLEAGKVNKLEVKFIDLV